MAGARFSDEPAAARTRSLVEAAVALPGQPTATAGARRWRSAELFGTDQEVEIQHGQAVYRLRLTSLGKLILTK